ncbi:S-layer homology domain-containing protein [Mesobacillus jeotgali]|uniref:S-layer homology domain-containing protein n=1 Tax=Mesobacillus jeotgali TaxID=129985 RepID=UPI0017804A9D|nr:S-layer homology domain-containing protein [Mesobacillus jeotgali]UYZ21812.1 S-layer homology domain-containing protein [Mesobacillus jeotgali]
MKKSYRKMVAIAATALMVASAGFSSAAADFSDVTPRYADSIDFLVSKGAKGMSDSSFGISEQIKRIDAAILTAKVLGLDTDKAPNSGFKDVPDRGQAAVNALKAAGITSGKTKTLFDSNSPITRGEVAIWIQKGFDLKGGTDLSFKDVPKNYQPAVQALVANGVAKGMSAENFGINANVKRGDFGIFLYKSSKEDVVISEILSIQSVDSTTLHLKLKDDVTDLKASDFVFDNGLEVIEAKIISSSSAEVTVELKTSIQQEGTKYTLLTFKGIKVTGVVEFTIPVAGNGGGGATGPAMVNPANFNGTAENPKVFYGDVRVDVTGVEKLENATVKGDLYLKGNTEVVLFNVTVEGDTILED